MLYYTYIIQSEKNSKHYYGSTANLEQRLKDHNAGRTKSTKNGRPWKLIYSEQYPTKQEAIKRELFFKSIDGFNFLKAKGII